MPNPEELQFPLRLTQAQRQAVAGLFSEFVDRLQLDEPNERTPRFTVAELRQVFVRCCRAYPHATSGMRRNSLRHVIDLTKAAVRKYQKGIARIPVSQRVYQFKITLKGMKPPIWRRIQIKNGILDKLHSHIQTAMGWTNSHLHQFQIEGDLYGDPGLLLQGFEDEPDVVDSLATRISDIVPHDGRKHTFDYEYDFGDCWEHEILFEGCFRAVKGTRYPLCVEGERACPPGDVGGPDGYRRYLDTLSDPDHEEWDETSEWRGPCRPEHFDAEAATKAMRKGLPNWRKMK